MGTAKFRVTLIAAASSKRQDNEALGLLADPMAMSTVAKSNTSNIWSGPQAKGSAPFLGSDNP